MGRNDTSFIRQKYLYIGRYEDNYGRCDVKQAMGRYQADGVSEEYAHLERRWNMGGHQLREVIGSIRNSLGDNDDIGTRIGGAAGHEDCPALCL